MRVLVESTFLILQNLFLLLIWQWYEIWTMDYITILKYNVVKKYNDVKISIVTWWWYMTQLLFLMFFQIWSTERSDFVSTTYDSVSTTIFRNPFSYTNCKKDLKKSYFDWETSWNQLVRMTSASMSLYEQVCLMRLRFERYFTHTQCLTLSYEGIHYNKHRVNFIYSCALQKCNSNVFQFLLEETREEKGICY